MNQLILQECLLALQTTLYFLPKETLREYSISLDDLINNIQMMLTTNQLADTTMDE